MTFAETLSHIQAEHGETNYRLAKEIGVHQTSIKNWKSGANKPHPRHVQAIERHYRLKKGTLLAVAKGSGESDEDTGGNGMTGIDAEITVRFKSR